MLWGVNNVRYFFKLARHPHFSVAIDAFASTILTTSSVTPGSHMNSKFCMSSCHV